MNYKKLSLLLTGLVMILGTTTAFAIWDSLSTEVDGNTINIGDGVDVSVTAPVNVNDWLGGDFLVPTNAILQEGYVTSASNVFHVEIDATLEADLFLDINWDNLNIGGVSTYNDVVDILIEWSYTNNNFNSTIQDNNLDHAENNLPNFYDSANTSTRPDVYFRVTVTLADASEIDQTEYDGIKGQPITFNLNFLAAE